MARTLAAALLLTAWTSLAQEAPPPPSPPGRMPHLRLYLGGATATQASSGTGGAAVIGIQGYSDLLPMLQTYWGTEVVGVRVGDLLFPVIDGDLGLRLTPFPDWPLRPYLRANVGLSILAILPIPSAGVAVGAILPIFNTIFLDMAFGVRRALNLFDTTATLDLGVFELSIGF